MDFERPFLFVLFVLPSLLGAHGDLGWWKDPTLFLRTGDRGLISTGEGVFLYLLVRSWFGGAYCLVH